MKKYIFIAAFSVSAGCMMGCNHHSSKKSDAHYLARVGTSYLTLHEARQALPPLPKQEDSSLALQKYRTHWIHQQLLLLEAQRLHLDKQTDVQKKLEKTRHEVLIEALQRVIRSRYQKQSSVSDSAARKLYQNNKQKLSLNERFIRFRQVETPDFSKARRARAMLQHDSSWTMVAQKYSEHASKNIRMARRFWPISSVFNHNSAMKTYVTRLDSGEISPIKRYKGHYYFIQMTSVREQGTTADASWFLGQLTQWIKLDRQQKYYHSYLQNLYLLAKKNNEIQLYNVDDAQSNEKYDSTIKNDE